MKYVKYVILFFSLTSLFAQSPRMLLQSHRYNDAVAQVLGQAQSTADLSEADKVTLVQTLFSRAMLYRDASQLLDRIGYLYYSFRDTSRLAQKSAYTPYFLGRYAFQQKEYQTGMRALQRIKEGHLPAPYLELARVWRAACQARDNDPAAARSVWTQTAQSSSARVRAETALARWQCGQPADPVGIAGQTIAEQRLALWYALYSSSDSDIAFLHHPLYNMVQADKQHDFGSFEVNYYDPATLMILAQADFRAAQRIAQSVNDPKFKAAAPLLAGMCAYYSGDHEKAKTLLHPISHPKARIYLGAALAATGEESQANSMWQTPKTGSDALKAEWIQVAAPFAAWKTECLRMGKQVARSLPNTEASMASALMLGRAALQLEEYEWALKKIMITYPANYKNRVDKINPSFLLVLAHLNIVNGRATYPEALGSVQSVKEVFAVLDPLVDLTQGFTSPGENESDDVRVQ